VWNFVDTLWKWEYESHLLHMLHTNELPYDKYSLKL
jgi:hypothetical protein